MFDVVDTAWLQFESVKRFAESYNGVYDEKTHSFIFGEYRNEMVYYSFSRIQQDHNEDDNPYKIVEKSTLQYHKKDKKFVAQKQLVKLVE